MTWLTLSAGVSRNTANTVLVALRFIFDVVFRAIHTALTTAGISVGHISGIALPSDVRTLYKHGNLEPELIRTPCCPKCYTQYPGGTLLNHCSWKRSPWAKQCGEELYQHRHTKDGPKRVPRCLYTSQSFPSWLTWFLSRPRIDECLHQTFTQHQNPPQPHPGRRMYDIFDSPAWESLRGYLLTAYHLVFGMYIDWFNPFTNKISGKFNHRYPWYCLIYL